MPDKKENKGKKITALGVNDRRLMRYLRSHPHTARHELTEFVGVTPQAIGQIVSRLIKRDLLVQHPSIKEGRHGQPAKPLSVKASAAYSLGIKIGRRHTDVVLVDLMGQVCSRHSIPYEKPVVQYLLPLIQMQIARTESELCTQNKQLLGIGLAVPLAMGGWQTLLKLSAHESLAWNQLDLVGAISKMTQVPVRMIKDTAAACMAELLDGHGRIHKNFLYIFVDTFVGGAMVQDGVLAKTKHGNAGAVASMPISAVPIQNAQLQHIQVVSLASLWELEQRLSHANLDPLNAYETDALLGAYAAHTAQWLHLASQGLAYSIVNAVAVSDMEAVVIDGSMSAALVNGLVQATEQAMNKFNWEGLYKPEIMSGTVGADAGVIGGALLPLFEFFYA